MMPVEFDDDAPPDLVETSIGPVDEEKVVKVPITIVTGTETCYSLLWNAADRVGQDILELERQRF